MGILEVTAAQPPFQKGFFDRLRPQGSPLCEYEQTRDSVHLGREGSSRGKWEDRSCGKRACPRRNRRNPGINFECFLNSKYSGCAFGDARRNAATSAQHGPSAGAVAWIQRRTRRFEWQKQWRYQQCRQWHAFEWQKTWRDQRCRQWHAFERQRNGAFVLSLPCSCSGAVFPPLFRPPALGESQTDA